LCCAALRCAAMRSIARRVLSFKRGRRGCEWGWSLSTAHLSLNVPHASASPTSAPAREWGACTLAPAPHAGAGRWACSVTSWAGRRAPRGAAAACWAALMDVPFALLWLPSRVPPAAMPRRRRACSAGVGVCSAKERTRRPDAGSAAHTHHASHTPSCRFEISLYLDNKTARRPAPCRVVRTAKHGPGSSAHHLLLL
jgi:hypothetical protein